MELIQRLGHKPVHIIGHSMGGFIALHVAAKLQTLVKSLILCSTAAKQVPEAIIYLNERLKLIDTNKLESTATNSKENIRTVMDKLYCAKSLKDPVFVANIIQHEASNPHPQTANSLKRQIVACIQHDAEHLLPSILSPTLIITGEYDPYYTPLRAEQLAKQLTHTKTQVSIIADAAHMLQLEQPTKLFTTLDNFITNHFCL